MLGPVPSTFGVTETVKQNHKSSVGMWEGFCENRLFGADHVAVGPAKTQLDAQIAALSVEFVSPQSIE